MSGFCKRTKARAISILKREAAIQMMIFKRCLSFLYDGRWRTKRGMLSLARKWSTRKNVLRAAFVVLVICIVRLIYDSGTLKDHEFLTRAVFRNLFRNDDILPWGSDKDATDPVFLIQRVALLTQEVSRLRTMKFRPPSELPKLPMIYMITPTFYRNHQKAELTRLSQTLMLVPNLHWIVIEDAENKSSLVANLLAKSGLSYTHLQATTPPVFKKGPKATAKGVFQRNAGLFWVRDNTLNDQDGVIYFGDDDNTYSIEIFEEMRWIKRVGVWPVGLVGGAMVERPDVNASGIVVGWKTMFFKKRKFQTDMAGFAIHVSLIHQHVLARFTYDFPRCTQEDKFLQFFVEDLSQLEPRANNCTKVLVWHTKSNNPSMNVETALKKAGKPPTNVGIEV